MLAITINRVYWSLKASVLLTQDVSWPTWMEPTHTQFSSLPNLTSNQLFTWKFVLNSQHALTVLNRMCAPSQVLVSTFSLFCRFWPLLSPSASKQSIAHLFTRTRIHLHRLTSVGAPDHNLCLIYAQLCCEATRHGASSVL